MFDIGWDEMLFTAIVAIVVIGPKDLPRALRTAGRWIGKVRRVSGHFRAGVENMIREAELQELEAQWREQNAAIMRGLPNVPADPATAEAAVEAPDPGTVASAPDATPPTSSPSADAPPPATAVVAEAAGGKPARPRKPR